MPEGINKLWLLLVIPVVCLALPIALFTMMTGTRLLSSWTGPANIFKATYHAPPAGDVAGNYQLESRSRDLLAKRGVFVSSQARIRLGADHTLEIIDMPAFDAFGFPQHCHYGGEGSWTFDQRGSGVRMDFKITLRAAVAAGAPLCTDEQPGYAELLGRQAPYKIWYAIGNPDDGFGLAYVRQ